MILLPKDTSEDSLWWARAVVTLLGGTVILYFGGHALLGPESSSEFFGGIIVSVMTFFVTGFVVMNVLTRTETDIADYKSLLAFEENQEKYRDYLSRRNSILPYDKFAKKLSRAMPELPEMMGGMFLQTVDTIYHEALERRPPTRTDRFGRVFHDEAWIASGRSPDDGFDVFLQAARALAKHAPMDPAPGADYLGFAVPYAQILTPEAISAYLACFSSKPARDTFPFVQEWMADHTRKFVGMAPPSLDSKQSAWKDYHKAVEDAQNRADTIIASIPPALVFPFLVNTTVSIPYKKLHQHVHLLGLSGTGKTFLVEQVAHAIITGGGKSVVIVDSQGEMIPKLLERQFLHAGKYPPVYISPDDIPAINVFELPEGANPEQAVNSATSILSFMFETKKTELTGLQATPFAIAVQLMFALPAVLDRPMTIDDFEGLHKHPVPDELFQGIKKLDHPAARSFLSNLGDEAYRKRRQEIGHRIEGLRHTPALSRLFASKTTEFSFFRELNKGRVIFIDTARGTLFRDTGMFGRFFLSLIFQAIDQRGGTKNKLNDAFVFIDEAQEYIETASEDQFERMLDQARKQQVSLWFSLHRLSDAKSASLKGALSGTGTKIISKVIDDDWGPVARSLGRSDPDSIASLREREFLIYSPPHTGTPMKFSFNSPDVSTLPKITSAEMAEWRRKNREQLGMADSTQTTKLSKPNAPTNPVSDQNF
jgi:hypothetical protein